jgi:hypothetical protein
MLNINQERLSGIVQDALSKAGDSKRWMKAIVRAAVEIQVNPFIEWQNNSLLILSPSNEIYEANGSCQCKAFEQGFPCWHRAAARLVQIYKETSH